MWHNTFTQTGFKMLPAFGRSNVVDLKRQALQVQRLEQTPRQQNHFGIGGWAIESKQLDTYLMELTLTACLGALITEHGPHVEKFYRLWPATHPLFDKAR